MYKYKWLEFIAFVWQRYVLRCRNIGFGPCRWGVVCGSGAPGKVGRLFLDEDMCPDCYFNDYVENYK